VHARQLWPRSLLAPFTDNVDLTPADERAYTSYARTERHKSFENIDVSFGKPRIPDPETTVLDGIHPAGDGPPRDRAIP
jgi:membrane protein